MFKRIIKLNAMLLAASALLAGCAGRAEENINDSVINGEDIHIAVGNGSEHPAQGDTEKEPSASDPAITGNMPDGTEETAPAQEDKKTRPKIGEQKLHLDMDSRIKAVGEDKLLVYGNKEILLLDMYTLEILKRADNETYGNTLSGSRIWEIEDGGYIVSGRLYDEASSGKKLVMIDYDSELQAGSVVNLYELLGQETEKIFANNYEFFDNGQKLLYPLAQHQKFSFYLYSFQNGEITEIVPQRDIIVDGFLYLQSKNQILYQGLDENHQNVLVRMDMDGKILDTNSEHYYGNMWDFHDFVLIRESVPMNKEGECAFFRYDLNDGSVQSFPLVEGNKTADFSIEMKAHTSSGGKYYATYKLLGDKGICYELHIYSSEDGSLVRELQLSSEEFGEGFMIRAIYIDDEAERMIIYGFWANRLMETWIVSKDLFE